MNLDFEKIQQLVDAGYVAKRKHPLHDLYILNYSAKCQWERNWSSETLACRGLVVDSSNRVVGRSFEKFFNYEELEQIPSEFERFQTAIRDAELFKVSEKMDGSLIICFDWCDEMIVASRGSFESDQSMWAREILEEKYPRFHPDPGYTYLFELIHPENRIVVNYGNRADLYLLGVIHTETGVECINTTDTAFPEPWSSEDFENFAAIRERPQRPNEEGFVVTFYESGLRVKLKWEEYKRLHKLLTGVTPKTIWEILSAGGSLNEMLDVVPDEWMQWVRQVEQDLTDRFRSIYETCQVDYGAACRLNLTGRKEFAEFFKQCQFPAVLFKMLDSQDVSPIIWKHVKPEGGGAFRCAVNHHE